VLLVWTFSLILPFSGQVIVRCLALFRLFRWYRPLPPFLLNGGFLFIHVCFPPVFVLLAFSYRQSCKIYPPSLLVRNSVRSPNKYSVFPDVEFCFSFLSLSSLNSISSPQTLFQERVLHPQFDFLLGVLLFFPWLGACLGSGLRYNPSSPLTFFTVLYFRFFRRDLSGG